MPETKKICPLTKETCDPLSKDPLQTSNMNCTFFQEDMFAGRCFYIDAMKALPVLAENVKKIKLSA